MVMVMSMVMIAGTTLFMVMMLMPFFGEQVMHHIHENRLDLLILSTVNNHDAHLGSNLLKKRQRTFAKAVDGLWFAFFLKDFQ